MVQNVDFTIISKIKAFMPYFRYNFNIKSKILEFLKNFRSNHRFTITNKI